MNRRGRQRPGRSRQGGFTLLELVVTLVMLGVLLTFGVPAFEELIQNNRLTAATNDLVSTLNLSRGEAITRGSRVTVCKSATGGTCAATGGWEQGWIAFADEDNDAQYTAGSEDLLRVREAVGGNITIGGDTDVADYVSYNARGSSELINGDPQIGTITICDNRSGNVGRDIDLQASGALRAHREVACP